MSPRQVWERGLGWRGSRPNEEESQQRRRLSQAGAESLKLGGPQGPCSIGCLQSALGSSLTWEPPGHVAPLITTDDRHLSGKAPATSEMKPKA